MLDKIRELAQDAVGASKYILSAEIETINDAPNRYRSNATTHPLVLEMNPNSAELAKSITDVINRSPLLRSHSSLLDFENGRPPIPLIHVGFKTTYMNKSLVNESRSSQHHLLLASLRQVCFDPKQEASRVVLFHDSNLPDELHKAFDRVDTDHSGGISFREIQAIIPNHAKAQVVFNEYDINKDGIIDFQEWLSVGLLDFLKHGKIVVREFLRHDRALRDQVQEAWNKKWGVYMPRPEALHYLGPDCTMYCEFLTFYSRKLLILAVVGVIVAIFTVVVPFANNSSNSSTSNGMVMLGFACFTSLWSSFSLALWSQRQYALEEVWGTATSYNNYMKFIKLPSLNSFQPNNNIRVKKKIGNNQNEPWLRLRRFSTSIASLILLFIVFYVDLHLLRWKVSLDAFLSTDIIVTKHSYVYRKLYSFIPSTVKAGVMTIFDEIFRHFVHYCIIVEKRSTKADEQDSRILKLVGFQCVSKFLFLFYFSFALQDIWKLQTSLFVILLTSMFFQNAKEVVLPYMKTRWKEATLLHRRVQYLQQQQEKQHENSAKNEEKNKNMNKTTLMLTELQEDYLLKEYDDTFEDYIEMLLQYGQITLFASVFPLGGMLAFINNLIEIRGDSYKMLFEMNLMLPYDDRILLTGRSSKHYHAINLWVKAFTFLSLISTISNVLLLSCDDNPLQQGYDHWMMGVTLSESYGPITSFLEIILVMVLLEHLLFICKGCIFYYLPERGGDKMMQNIAAEYNGKMKNDIDETDLTSEKKKQN